MRGLIIVVLLVALEACWPLTHRHRDVTVYLDGYPHRPLTYCVPCADQNAAYEQDMRGGLSFDDYYNLEDR